MPAKPKRRSRPRAPVKPHSPRGEHQPPYASLAGPWYLHAGALVLLLVGTCLLYTPALGLGFFHLDDPTYILTNPWIKELSWANIRHILTTPYFANFSPLHLLTYSLDYRIAGESAWAFHLSNLIWGGLVAGQVYLLGLALLSPRYPSVPGRNDTASPGLAALRAVALPFLAAALFVVHPAHVEAVAWISSRKDLVAAAFALPALLAYLIHRRNPIYRVAYVLSVVFFALAVAGKMSVVVLPGVMVIFDWLVEKRRDWSMLLDKIPYVAVAVVFALPTLQAQPATQQQFSLQILGESTLRHLWLLTGFGDYVLLHGKQSPPLLRLFGILGPCLMVVVPLLMQRRWPGLPLALFYWILLALLPSQVLSFINPVADRYVFFPSTAAVLLLVWALDRMRLPARWSWLRWLVGAVLVAAWSLKTVAYLEEWNDPRSVWFNARARSGDYLTYQYLGTHYQDQADQLVENLNSPRRAQTIALARTLSTNEVQFQALLDEWEKNPRPNGPQTAAFQTRLRHLAVEQLQEALARRGSRLAPNLYFRLGKVAYDNNDLEQARASFLQAEQQAQKHTSIDVREEIAVRGQHALALVEWKARNFQDALRWLSLAEEAQRRSQRAYIPELGAQRQQLEQIIASQR